MASQAENRAVEYEYWDEASYVHAVRLQPRARRLMKVDRFIYNFLVHKRMDVAFHILFVATILLAALGFLNARVSVQLG